MGTTTKYRQERDKARKLATHEMLLDAAEIVFVRLGYHTTRIGDIVADAQMGQGTFYRHFTSKEAIFEALFQRLATRLLSGFAASTMEFPNTMTAHRKLCLSGAKRMGHVLETNRDLVLLFLRQGPAVSPAFERKLEKFYQRGAQMALAFMQNGIKKGFIRPCDAEIVVQSVVGQVLRLVTIWLDGRLGDRTAADVAESIIDMWIVGYAKNE